MRDVLLGDDWRRFGNRAAPCHRACTAHSSCTIAAQTMHAMPLLRQRMHSTSIQVRQAAACERQTKEQVAGNSVHVYHAVACRHPW